MFKTIFLAASCAVAFPIFLNYVEEVQKIDHAELELVEEIRNINRHYNRLDW